MTERNADKVRALIEAINAGDRDHALQFFRSEIVLHDPDVTAGAEGFQNYILGLSERRSQMEVVRLLEDGPFVVAQLRSDKANQDRFAVYRFEGGQVAEQWDFVAAAAPPNTSGHTQVDGPRKPRHLELTEANKLFARKYYETFHLAGARGHNNEFFSGDTMIRHEAGVEDGLGNFLKDVEQLMKQRSIDEIRLLIGQGDLVFIAAAGTHQGKPCVYVDLYRIENLKIAEHWGFPQMVPQDADRLNSVAML